MDDDGAKRDGWTWTKEILGTAVAVIGVMAIPSAWVFSTLQGVILAQAELRGTQALQAVEISHLKEGSSLTVARGEKIDGKLDRILEQIADIKIDAAKRAASSGKP